MLVSAGILGLYISNNPEWSWNVVGLVLLVAALLIVSPFLEKRSVLGQEYWITDQRAIFMSRTGLSIPWNCLTSMISGW